MKPNPAPLPAPAPPAALLALVAALLAAAAALAGLLWPADPQPLSVTTAWGEQIDLYGRGLYRRDTLLIGSGFRGADVVTLLLGAPLTALAALRARRGSLRGLLLLGGALSYLLYAYASMALGAFYNPLFPLYLALFALSLAAMILALLAVDSAALPARILPGYPHRAQILFLIVVGSVLLIIWLGLSMLPAALAGRPPAELSHYHTVVTYLLDLGVIAPACFALAWLLGRRAAAGYPAGAAMVVLSWLMGANIAAATISQFRAGYPYTAAQVIALVAPFVVLGGVGVWLTRRVLRHVRDGPAA